MPAKRDHLLPVAFYGTLLEGLPVKPGRPSFEPYGRYGGPCLLRGSLYDVGPFPCLTDGDGLVRGQLWQPLDRMGLTLLDEWEEYDTANEDSSTYVRHAVQLEKPRIRAWVYLYNKPVVDLPVIESGDWASLTKAHDLEELLRRTAVRA